jgi:hypothetical protein
VTGTLGILDRAARRGFTDVFTTKHYPMWCLSCNQTVLCSHFHPNFVCKHDSEYGECRLPDFSCQCHT